MWSYHGTELLKPKTQSSVCAGACALVDPSFALKLVEETSYFMCAWLTWRRCVAVALSTGPVVIATDLIAAVVEQVAAREAQLAAALGCADRFFFPEDSSF